MKALPKPLSRAINKAFDRSGGKVTPAAEMFAEMLRADERLRLIAAFMVLSLAVDEDPAEFFERFCSKDIFDGASA